VVNKIALWICCLILAGNAISAQNSHYADSLRLHYSDKTNRFLDRDHALGDHYSITLTGVSIYADAETKRLDLPEYTVTWTELPVYQNIMATAPRPEAIRIMKEKGSGPFSAAVLQSYATNKNTPAPKGNGSKVLAGYRIAIDPGHFAGDSATAHIEDKYIDMCMVIGADSERVSFYESALTWQTGIALKELLENAGAEVFMTRPAFGLSAFGKSFDQWKKDDYARTLDSLLKINPNDPNLKKLKSGRLKDDKSIFRFVFRDAELRKRSELINAYRPDLTVIIHYNVDEQNKDWKKPTDKNYCMAFVGGSFKPGELSDPERRFDFLRLMLTGDLENSIYAAGLATNAFQSELEVPLAKQGDASYLQSSCIAAAEPGVFLRNLSLTRMIQGPVIYGETLYQDNKNECRWLADASVQTPNGESRVEQVASAYYQGILNWAKTR
jgi:N-acetylmuramoyl-L-alanine amidase